MVLWLMIFLQKHNRIFQQRILPEFSSTDRSSNLLFPASRSSSFFLLIDLSNFPESNFFQPSGTLGGNPLSSWESGNIPLECSRKRTSLLIQYELWERNQNKTANKYRFEGTMFVAILANPTAMISQRTNVLLKNYVHNIIRYFNTFSKLFAQQRGLLNEGCFSTNYLFTILYNNILWCQLLLTKKDEKRYVK